MANAKHKTTEELLSEIEELKQNLSEANKALKKQLSDSRQHEEKSEQFLNSVYNGTNLAIAVVDVNEANEYHFKGVNRKHESIFGFKNEVYIGKTPKQLEKYFGKETIDSIVMRIKS